MIVSDACPIQFWEPSESTFNETEVDGITAVCFCQPMKTDDTFPIQINDEGTSPDEFLLLTVDQYDSIIDSVGFTPSVGNYQVANAAIATPGLYQFLIVTPGSLTIVENADDWTSTASPFTSRTDDTFTVSSSVDITCAATMPIVVAADKRIRITTSTVISGVFSGFVTVTMVLSGGEVISPTLPEDYIFSAAGTYDVEWILEGPATVIEFTIAIDISSGTVQADVTIENGSYLKFNENFIEMKSDCIDVRSDWPCTQKLSYSNADDFAGLQYSSIGSPTFNFRVPAMFFHEEPVEEMEDHELSTNEIIQVSAKLERKRKFEVGYVPYYFHEKIRLALAHQYVAINNERYIKRTNDRYDITAGRKTYPLKMATVLLTDQNYIKRNLK